MHRWNVFLEKENKTLSVQNRNLRKYLEEEIENNEEQESEDNQIIEDESEQVEEMQRFMSEPQMKEQRSTDDYWIERIVSQNSNNEKQEKEQNDPHAQKYMPKSYFSNRRRLAHEGLITYARERDIQLQCKKYCRSMTARIGRSAGHKIEKKFDKVLDRTIEGAETYAGKILGAVYEKAQKSFAAGTHFAEESRPYGLIIQNASSPSGGTDGETFTMEYIEFDALSGMEFEYRNWSKYRKRKEKSDTEAAEDDDDDENEDETENTDENENEEKIEPGETAVVKLTNSNFLCGVSGTAKINIPELNKQIHVYVENPRMGSYLCCMGFVEPGQQLDTSKCSDAKSQNIWFGKMLIHKEARWESFDTPNGTEKSRMCRVSLLPKTAEKLPAIPNFY
jgi:DNA mismatch repair ATPase MutL